MKRKKLDPHKQLERDQKMIMGNIVAALLLTLLQIPIYLMPKAKTGLGVIAVLIVLAWIWYNIKTYFEYTVEW